MFCRSHSCSCVEIKAVLWCWWCSCRAVWKCFTFAWRRDASWYKILKSLPPVWQQCYVCLSVCVCVFRACQRRSPPFMVWWIKAWTWWWIFPTSSGTRRQQKWPNLKNRCFHQNSLEWVKILHLITFMLNVFSCGEKQTVVLQQQAAVEIKSVSD